jgi:DNA-binding IclR family transcriptional regulator
LNKQNNEDTRREEVMPVYPVKSAERVIQILELFRAVRKPMRLNTVASELSWPIPSTVALLKTLVGMGYLVFSSADRTYFPSPHVASLGDWVEPAFFEDSRALEIANRLRSETTEHVLLSVHSGLHVQHVKVLHGVDDARYGARDGSLRLVVKSSPGLVLLGAMPVQAVDRICRQINIKYRNKTERIDPDQFSKTIASVKRQGFSSLYGVPHVEGAVLSMLLPPTQSGKRIAVSVGGRKERIQQNRDRLLQKMADVIAAA